MKSTTTNSDQQLSLHHTDEQRTSKQKLAFAIEVILLSILLFATFNSFGQSPAQSTQATVSGQSAQLNLVKQTVVYNSGKIYMNWIAPSDAVDCIYVIERSSDGEEYEPVGLKEGIGSPLELLYSWVDQKPIQGIAYYRIKQINSEGNLMAQGSTNTISTPEAGPIKDENTIRSVSVK